VQYQVYVTRQNGTGHNLKNTTKVKDIIKGQYDNGLAKKIDLDRTMVRISNINTLQQTINAVTLQRKLKFFMGLPVDTRFLFLKRFKYSNAFIGSDTTTRTEYLLLKRTRVGIKIY
jgi:hypothetical protein